MDITGIIYHFGVCTTLGKDPDGNVFATLYADDAHDTVISVQRDGTIQTRPAEAQGNFERVKIEGKLGTVNSKNDDGSPVVHTFVLVNAKGLL